MEIDCSEAGSKNKNQNKILNRTTWTGSDS